MVYGDKIRRSNPSNPCPVCGGTGCGQSEAKAFCFRVQDGAIGTTKLGSFVHWRTDKPVDYVRPRRIELPLASIERRHTVFSALLDELILNRQHGEELAGSKRRLSKDTIARIGFKSVPDRMVGDEMAGQLASKWELKGVPGFWRKDGRWCLRFSGWNGYYIPLRNLHGQIEALQIRATSGDAKYLLVSSDNLPDGISSGAPHHFAGRPCEVLIVTEGALKAEVISEAKRRRNEADFVCGLVSVTTFDDNFGHWLRRSIPALQTIQLAFDSDWKTNEKVQAQMKRIAIAIKAAGLKLQVLNWESEAKGYDDELLRGER